MTPLALYSADKSVSVQTHTYTHTHTQTNKQTNKQTNDISILCLSAYVDNKCVGPSCCQTENPKCTLAVSHAAPWRVTASMPTGQTDRRTDRRVPDRYIRPTLSASISQCNNQLPFYAHFIHTVRKYERRYTKSYIHCVSKKKLSYRRGTARRAMLVNSCYISRVMGVI